MKPRALLTWLVALALVACGGDARTKPHAFGAGPGIGTGFTLQGPGVFAPISLPWNWTSGAAPATTTMSVAMTDSADPVITGADAYSYSVALTNTGGAAATSVSVATTLDASLAYVSSSGTGWSCSYSAPTVTCTAASIGTGAAPAITINVTTGTSAVSASSSVVASASNASNATASQGTTVQLVTKDATAGIYLPASSTEWSNFISRKGLSVAVPSHLWLLGAPASGSVSDSIGTATLAASGTGGTYQASVTGWSTKGISTTDAASFGFISTSTTLPDISTTSAFTVLLSYTSSLPAATRIEFGQGTTTTNVMNLTTAAKIQIKSAANSFIGSNAINGFATPLGIRTNRTAGTVTGFTLSEKMIPTTGAATGKELFIGTGDQPGAWIEAWQWDGTNAEISDANFKALEQAMGFSPTWN